MRAIKAVVRGDLPLAARTSWRQHSEVKTYRQTLTYCCCEVRIAFRSIEDPCPEDGTDFSSHAADASPDISRYDCRGVVVAGHTD
jgi:hypothetical protein